MYVEDSYALLAPLSTNGTQPKVLVTDDDRFEVHAEALARIVHQRPAPTPS